jgi:hypothetical protein
MEKPNTIIAKYRLLFGFCPNCNSDAPKKDNCKICNNGEFKTRSELSQRFEKYNYLYLHQKDRQNIDNCIDWIKQINGIK